MRAQAPVGKHLFLPTSGIVLEQGPLGASLLVWGLTAQTDDRNILLSGVLRDAVTILHPHKCQMGPKSDEWLYQENVPSHTWTEGDLPSHQRFGTSIFSCPCPLFKYLSEILSRKCWPICC